MKHVADRRSRILSSLKRDPLELVRYARVAWSTFRYRYLQRCVGAGTIVGEQTCMINAGNIRIGERCLIQDRVYVRAGVDGSLTIGDEAALNSFVRIFSHGGVTIGAHSQVGPGTILTTTGHDYSAAELEANTASITIGERVWIGANCTILPGVSIGDRAVIGAGAVVTRDIPPDSLAVGVPARVVRSLAGKPAEPDAGFRGVSARRRQAVP